MTIGISYPGDLPITARREDLLETIAANQVVVIAGETGSGKSTQIPKLCLELGRGGQSGTADGTVPDGRAKWIGHTQPRRIAARSVAERVAEELGEAVGDTVGYAVRFTDTVSPATRVKLMTDGILLAEIQRDRTLSRYDTIIIDEAHERSLNIDFLLGYLKQLLPRRPDLKVIITSATIDTARFAEHFDDAPIIEVTGRTFPVEIRYRPLDRHPDGSLRDEPLDQADAIAEAVRELWRTEQGDILVFCSGEREIRDAAQTIDELGLRHLETLPLYARLSAAEQHRVFATHQRRRVVIATNVAETSLTVPGVRSVIDSGLARVSRYSNRTKVQRLPIERISQASADQRAGRCGRVAPGVCIRLYTEDDYDARPEFTEPEIQRTNLASVILQMASLGLGQIERFPFVEPPDNRSIRDGIGLLEELDAVDPEEEGTRRWLTPLGRRLARLPIDPRLGRMILEAEHEGSVREVLIIAAALSIQDPRERPSDQREAADQLHRRFAHPSSDFLTYVELWDHLRAEQRARSSSAFRRMCRKEFLHHQRIREWQDLERQLRRVARQLDLHSNDRPAHPDAVHRALLSGLISQIGMREPPKAKKQAKKSGGRARRARTEYLGARGTRFAVAPGSSLTGAGSAWVMAGEIVETNRLWARTVAGIDPRWLEDIAHHLISRTFVEPRWDPERGTPVVTERVSLFGLPVVGGRTITLGSVDPGLARELFIHHGLIEREWPEGHPFLTKPFLRQNDAVLEELRALEARSRTSAIEDELSALTRFYDERIGSSVVSVGHFNRWWKKRRAKDPHALDLDIEHLLDGPIAIDHDAFPVVWDDPAVGPLPISYEFDASSPIDGITIDIPLVALPGVDADRFRWHVPGFRTELIEQLLRSLPKETRKAFVPIPDTARRIAPDLDPDRGSIEVELARTLSRTTGTTVDPATFDHDRLAKHLRPTFRIVGPDGATVAAGKRLDAIRARLEGSLQAAVTDGFADLRRRGARSWEFGTIDRRVEASMPAGRHTLIGYPALVDEGETVGLDVVSTEEEQQAHMWDGTRRLLRFHLRQPARSLDRHLADRTRLALTTGPVQTRVQWTNDAIDSVIDHSLARAGGPVWDDESFVELARTVRDESAHRLASVAATIDALIEHHRVIVERLEALESGFAEPVADGRRHLARLLYPGVLTGVGFDRHDDLVRCLAGVRHRFEVLAEHPNRDRDHLRTVLELERDYRALVAQGGGSPETEDIGWMIEHYRVSVFAPALAPRRGERVSPKRIRAAIAAVSSS